MNPTGRTQVDLESESGGEMVYHVRATHAGLEAWIALNGVESGPGFGGIRRRRYSNADAARSEVRRLASQMALKVKLAELSCAGAKCVIADHDELDRPAAYRALGEAVESLGGRFVCGPDLGTSDDDLDRLRESTDHVNHPENDPGPTTARGVAAGIRASLEHVFGSADAGGRRIAVQGLGSVGGALARRLAAAGAELMLADLAPSRAEDLAAEALELGAASARVISPDDLLEEEVELFCPCATGPIVDEATAGSRPWRILCGSANMQLANDGLADRLHENGVVYVPDFSVNSGAVIEGVIVAFEGRARGRQRAAVAIDAIEGRVASILSEADSSGVSPLRVALDRCEDGGRS